MAEVIKNRKIKLLQMGNSTYRSALNSSAMLLLKSVASPFQHFNPKVLCLASNDRLSRMAHVLFNQDGSSFGSLTVNQNEANDQLATQVEEILTHYDVEIILVLSEKSKFSKRMSRDQKVEELSDFASALLNKSSVLAKKIRTEQLLLVLGIYEPSTGEVKIRPYIRETP